MELLFTLFFFLLCFNATRPWVLNEDNPRVLLGPTELHSGQLNTWEAVPVTSSLSKVLVVKQWVSGAAQGSGGSVTLIGLTDGEHVLLLKARDRAGNLSPQHAWVNWTVDSTGPSNCSVVSFNARSLPGWARTSVLPAAVNSSAMLLQLAGSPEDVGGPFAAMDVRWRSTATRSSATGGTTRLVVDAATQIAVVTLQNLTDGAYRVEVVGEDSAGNRSPRPCANFSWAVDLTPPVGLFSTTMSCSSLPLFFLN